MLCTTLAMHALAAEPANPCAKPDFPGKRAPKVKLDQFNAQFKLYGECVAQFVAQQNQLIGEKEQAIARLRAEANAAIDAGRQATKEYQDFVTEVNRQIGA
jgi:hypothetical protein